MTPDDRAWAEIDLDALQRNADRLVEEAGGAALYAIVKANAYGHGVIPVTRALDSRVDRFGVASLDEALELHDAGMKANPYLLGTSLPSYRDLIVEKAFEPTISSLAEAQAWSELATRKKVELGVHYKIDTGMGRAGFPEQEWSTECVTELARLPGLRVEGIASHFPSADDDPDFTRDQIERFQAGLSLASKHGLKPRRVHLSNSAGILGFPEAHFDAIRPGLALYGISPLPERQSLLEPVLSLKSRVLDIRSLQAGHGVSYGRTHLLKKETRVASIGIGYGDGLPRSLSDEGAEVLIGGKRHPILGRVTMDQILVEVSDDTICPGDEVVLIGSQAEESILATEVAEKAGTITWEVFTGITPRVVRRGSPR